jgi:N-acetylneuraminate epimerase
MNGFRWIVTLFASIYIQGAFSDVPLIEWKILPERPSAVGGQYSGVSNDVLLAVGGANFPKPLFEGGKKVWVDSIYALKPGSKEWIEAGKLPRPLAYGGSVSDDRGLIIIGGGDSEQHYADVFCLRWVSGKIVIELLPSLPQASAFHTAVLVDNTIYVTGGQENPSASVAQHALWRLNLNQIEKGWHSIKPWPGPARILPVAAVHQGAFYLFGGCQLYADETGETKRRYLTDAYRYTNKDGWEKLPNLPRAVTAAPGPAWVYQDQIMIFSGDNGENADRVWELKERHPGFDRDMVVFDVKENRWTQTGKVPFSLATTQSVLWQGGYVIPGGEDRPGHRISTVYKGIIVEK